MYLSSCKRSLSYFRFPFFRTIITVLIRDASKVQMTIQKRFALFFVTFCYVFKLVISTFLRVRRDLQDFSLRGYTNHRQQGNSIYGVTKAPESKRVTIYLHYLVKYLSPFDSVADSPIFLRHIYTTTCILCFDGRPVTRF